MQTEFYTARSLIMKHEGFRQFVYKCPAGKLTIGYGLNLESTGVTKGQASYLLNDEIKDYPKQLREIIKNFYTLSVNRQAVLIDMAYALGMRGLSKFKIMIKALELNDFEIAANQILDSVFAVKAKNRAYELSEIMRTNLIDR